MIERIASQPQLMRDYQTVWHCIGPKDVRANSIPVQLPETMMPEEGVMIATICNHAPNCSSCRGWLKGRLDSYLKERSESR